MIQIDKLIKHGLVITQDASESIIEDGAVAISGTDIIAVGTTSDLSAQYEADEVIEASDQIVMPGLINAHTHATMCLLRGIADDLPLMKWLHKYIWPAEQRFVSAEFVRDGTELAIAEMLRAGITCFADQYFFPEIVAETAVCWPPSMSAFPRTSTASGEIASGRASPILPMAAVA